MSPANTPVVFVHGQWLHATSWDPWVDLFREAGYAPLAPGWPGDADTAEETRRQPDRVARKGIDDVVAHYAEIIRGLDRKPIVIGHSFGGLITQKLAGQGLAAGAVAIDPAPFRGVLPLPVSALRSAFPVLGNPLNKKKAVALTYEQFRYGFANEVSEEEAHELYEAYPVAGAGRRCSRPPSPTSTRTHPPRSTRGTRPGGRCW